MSDGALTLDAEQFAAVFPFHVACDDRGVALQVGRVLSRLCPGLSPGQPIADHLEIVRPKGAAFTVTDLQRLERSLFIVRAPQRRLMLRGQMLVDVARGRCIFLGSPWITRLDEVTALGLSLSDFANHDAIGEFLLLFQSKHQALAEAEALAERLDAQRRTLRDTNDALAEQMAQRARAELALRATEGRYRSVVETVSDIIFQIDLAGRWTLLNPPWESFTGYAVAESLGRPVVDFVSADQQVAVAQLLTSVLEGGEASCRRVIAFRTRSGASRNVAVCLEAVRSPAGDIVGLSGTGSDQTARLEHEERLRDANEMLSKANQLKDEFLSGMSHELRTPLNAILGLSESLSEGVYGALDERQRTALGHIESSGRHLLSLINEVLDLSKIEAGKLTLDIGDVALGSVCQSAVSMMQPAAARKGIALRYACDPAVTVIDGDDRRLKQVVLNLLSNAVKFTPEGGTVTLSVWGAVAQGEVIVSVRDTGPGIAANDMPRLFQPFSQLDAGLARRHGGTGLGLALTKRMVDLHHGRVTVESEIGRGSCFSVHLPWVRASAPTRPAVDAAPAGSPRAPAADASAPERPAMDALRPRVLLVDDTESNRLVIATYLDAHGFAVTTAVSGVTAIEAARSMRPDVILMDVQMPEMDGLEATRRLRTDPVVGGTPIIALTGDAMAGDRERCLAAGVNAYLSKPVRLSVLAERVRAYVAPRAAHA